MKEIAGLHGRCYQCCFLLNYLQYSWHRNWWRCLGSLRNLILQNFLKICFKPIGEINVYLWKRNPWSHMLTQCDVQQPLLGMWEIAGLRNWTKLKVAFLFYLHYWGIFKWVKTHWVFAKLSFNFNYNLVESWVSINFIFNTHQPPTHPPTQPRRKSLKNK